MRGRTRGLGVAALIDCDIDDDRSGLHRLDGGGGNQLRRRGARNERRADDQIGAPAQTCRWYRASRPGAHACAEASRDRSQLLRVAARSLSRRRPFRLRSARHCRRPCRRRSPATSAGATPGTPPSRMPRPPCGRSRYCAPTCAAIRPATSDIGVEQRQLALRDRSPFRRRSRPRPRPSDPWPAPGRARDAGR